MYLDKRPERLFITCCFLCLASSASAQWKKVYTQTFEELAEGAKTASKALPHWEAGSASGTVCDGKVKGVGKFLVASSSWNSFNQGPIFNLDLTPYPHDKVRISFDLYAFGEWRGIQQKTGGPQHRLMFFDNKAKPTFSFDTCFSTDARFKQAWPDRNPAKNIGGTGATAIQIDDKGKFKKAHRWRIQFEYATDSPALRFTMLCGAATGSGRPMPDFGIDNVRVFVRSTAPVIDPVDHPADIRKAKSRQKNSTGTSISFRLEKSGRVSLGVFEKNSNRLVRTLLGGEQLAGGSHQMTWDGLDNDGQPVSKGKYDWRLVHSRGLTARYVTTIGVNPPGGENPVPNKSWVGDHLGAGIVDVDLSGVYIGSPITEGGRMILKANSAMSKVLWSRPQFYQSGRLTRLATNGEHVFMIHPNGKLRRLGKDSGRVESEWQIDINGEAPVDLDAQGKNLVATYPSRGIIRWLSVETGKEVAQFLLAKTSVLAAISPDEKGATFASTGSDLYQVQPGSKTKVASFDGSITAMDYDPDRKELWLVVNSHKVIRLDENLKIAQTYSNQPREWGAYDPTRFAGIYDIASDLEGGFFIGEPSRAPRRIAHIARDGSVIGEWFGGMSFYIGGSFDPADSTRLIGIAPEGSVNVYRIDYEKASWKIEACYATGRLGDSIFPFTGSFKVVRRNEELYLFHREIPSVIRLDPKLRKAVPVAFAGSVRNRGRSMIQFAGTGRDGYPKPWVAAAEFHGYQKLAKAPKYFSWADTDGDGEFDPQEFHFYPIVNDGPNGGGDFFVNGDYLGKSKLNSRSAFVRIPVSAWEGPRKDAPRWDLSNQQSLGEVTANSHGFGSVRNTCISKQGSVAATYQAGVMIREHGQYEGGGWPECAVKGCRVLGFDSEFNPVFTIGRQSKVASETDTGVFFYPMHCTRGPNDSVVINDQTKQPAQVWTKDGLFVGGLFDNRTEDGLAKEFYQIHGDDNQGCTLVTRKNGRTYWLAPYQGHNRLYEITGWNDWTRQSGAVTLKSLPFPKANGTGLTAKYIQGNKVVLEMTEPPIYYEKFGPERHGEKLKPHYKVEWTGFIEPPVSDRFRFHTLLGKSEQIAIWIDGNLVHAAGLKPAFNQSKSIDLVARHRHQIRLEYINPDGRAELNLLWASRVIDHQRIPSHCLYPVAK